MFVEPLENGYRIWIERLWVQVPPLPTIDMGVEAQWKSAKIPFSNFVRH